MRYVWMLLLVCIIAGGCSWDGINEQKARSVRQKEQELKKREQRLRDKALARQTVSGNKTLRYLYVSDGVGTRTGMTGYFNDGTVRACPDCAYSRTNINIMSGYVSFASYTVQPDGSLLVDSLQRWVPDPKSDEGWVLVDYKWYKPIPW